MRAVVPAGCPRVVWRRLFYIQKLRCGAAASSSMSGPVSRR